jgi:hypothetical protein
MAVAVVAVVAVVVMLPSAVVAKASHAATRGRHMSMRRKLRLLHCLRLQSTATQLRVWIVIVRRRAAACRFRPSHMHSRGWQLPREAQVRAAVALSAHGVDAVG